MRRRGWAGLALLGAVGMAVAQKACVTPAAGAVDRRVDGLIARMTVEERIAQLGDRAPGIARLGLPAYNWWNEGLHGLARDGYATVFPQAIGLAATRDAELVKAVGEVVGTEARGKFAEHAGGDSPQYGGLTVWSPNINIFRDPRWGRGQETYGEDPFLTGTLGAAFVRGVQGEEGFWMRADATPKHFVAHSGPELGRDSFNAVVSAHDLEDTYLPAFRAAVREGGAAALMCSYNAVNGTPMCANGGLLGGTLRGKWGFGGYVVSDCDAVGNLTGYQHFTVDAEHGAAAALKAGVDLDCGNSYGALRGALAQGLVGMGEIDGALHRLLVAKARLGILLPGDCSPFAVAAGAVVDMEAHRALARRAAEESVVLLRNEGGVLPLKAGARLAVVGASADALGVLEANYHGTARAPVTPLEGLRARFPGVRYAQGSLLAAGLAAPIPRTALRVAEAAGSAEGLRAEYFEGAAFVGEPKVRAVVPRVDLDLDRVGPAAGVEGEYAARWSGYVTPVGAGDTVLEVKVERCWDCTRHDAFRLLVDGQVVLRNDGAAAEPRRVVMHWADTRAHAVTLELVHTGEDEGITLAWEPPAEAMLREAEAAARGADAVVVFAGLSPDLEGEALQVELEGFAGGDRTSLELPAAQRALIARMRATGKPVVLVLMSGSAIALDEGERESEAVLEAWYPGEEGGAAVAEVLAGKVNPSGRLPVTFYRSAADLPAFTDYSMRGRTYRYFGGPVEYPFGFGLSYTRFVYGPVRLARRELRAGETLEASVEVRNSGAVDGDEVVEAYVVPPAGLVGAPRLALVGVQRVRLRAGERRVVRFAVPARGLSTVDEAGVRAVRAGGYRLVVGGGQPVVAGDGVGFRILGRAGLGR